jgi:hypothetical protein
MILRCSATILARISTILCLVIFLGISQSHAQVQGLNSVAGRNLYLGAGGNVYMAIGPDGAVAIGPGWLNWNGQSWQGQPYDTWDMDSNPANYPVASIPAINGTPTSPGVPAIPGVGAMNISADGLPTFNLALGLNIGTATPLGEVLNISAGPAYAGLGIAQTPGNSQSIPIIIFNPVDDSHTAMALRNSQTSWELGIGNPAEHRYGIANKFYIANAATGNVALALDTSGRVEFNSAGNFYGNQLNTLDVAGNMAVGTGVIGVVSAPPNGLLVQNAVTLGTNVFSPQWEATTVVSKGPDPTVVLRNTAGVTVMLTNAATSGCISAYDTATGGELALGIYASSTGCARSVAMDSVSHVGIGVDPPVNGLDVAGNVAVGFGTCYPTDCGLNVPSTDTTLDWWPAAPPNGLIVGRGVMIGTTDPGFPYTSDWADMLKINGTAFASGGFSPISDRRFKQDVRPYTDDALNIVSELAPVTFFWKQARDAGMRGRQIGFIAQDVRPLLPEAVVASDNPDGLLGLNYDSLMPVLTKALQELTVENDNLQNRLTTLKVADAELRKRLRSDRVAAK